MGVKYLSVANLVQLSVDPDESTSVLGDLYVTDDGALRLFNGNQWITVGDTIDPFTELWTMLARIVTALKFLGIDPMEFSQDDFDEDALLGG